MKEKQQVGIKVPKFWAYVFLGGPKFSADAFRYMSVYRSNPCHLMMSYRRGFTLPNYIHRYFRKTSILHTNNQAINRDVSFVSLV